MKVILSLTILIATFISSTLSQRYIVASTDQQLASALNNRAYTATIVNYMTTTCSRSRYMKVYIFFYYKIYLIIPIVNFIQIIAIF